MKAMILNPLNSIVCLVQVENVFLFFYPVDDFLVEELYPLADANAAVLYLLVIGEDIVVRRLVCFFVLHPLHASFTFSQLCSPPLARGMTCSMEG